MEKIVICCSRLALIFSHFVREMAQLNDFAAGENGSSAAEGISWSGKTGWTFRWALARANANDHWAIGGAHLGPELAWDDERRKKKTPIWI